MRTVIACALLLAACGTDPVERVDPAARVDLRAALAIAGDLEPVGVAVAADGKRYVFDESYGLFRLDGPVGVSIVTRGNMPIPDEPVRPPYTDLVALAPDLFGLTAIGDGFLLDLQAQTLRQHFCYLPGEGGGVPVSISQRTDALTFDASSNRLLAQPVTYDAAGELQYAQIAFYDRATGADVEWHDVPRNTAATGMIVLPGAGIVLGQGSKLSVFDPATDTVSPFENLARFGVSSIDGLALDAVAGTLVVVDKQADAVFDIELAQIGL